MFGTDFRKKFFKTKLVAISAFGGYSVDAHTTIQYISELFSFKDNHLWVFAFFILQNNDYCDPTFSFFLNGSPNIFFPISHLYPGSALSDDHDDDELFLWYGWPTKGG